MCGIVGYIGPRTAQDILLNGLETLEYRGYDSAGIAARFVCLGCASLTGLGIRVMVAS